MKLREMTQSRLKHLLDLDEDTGVFYWKNPRSNHVRTGQVAGHIHKEHGYCKIKLDGKLHYGHRLVWLWVTGNFPENEIDHRNGDRADNRFENLRSANHAQNSQNLKRHSNNTSGFTGVYWDPFNEKWRAEIKVLGRKHRLGRFVDVADAHRAYLMAKAKLHTFQPTPRSG